MPEILFNNKELCKRIHGIIQVGTHCGEEYNHIKAAGWKHQIYFEPVRESFYYAVGYATVHRSPDEMQTFSNFALLDKPGDYIFYLGRNRGCSSFLRLNPDRPIEHLNNVSDGQLVLPVITLDKFFEDNNNLNPNNYNLLYMDTQGSELHVLKGAEKTLHSIHVICMEVNYFPIYLGTPTLDEIKEFLNQYNFDLLIDQPMVGNKLQGDAIFVKRGL